MNGGMRIRNVTVTKVWLFTAIDVLLGRESKILFMSKPAKGLTLLHILISYFRGNISVLLSWHNWSLWPLNEPFHRVVKIRFIYANTGKAEIHSELIIRVLCILNDNNSNFGRGFTFDSKHRVRRSKYIFSCENRQCWKCSILSSLDLICSNSNFKCDFMYDINPLSLHLTALHKRLVRARFSLSHLLRQRQWRLVTSVACSNSGSEAYC